MTKLGTWGVALALVVSAGAAWKWIGKDAPAGAADAAADPGLIYNRAWIDSKPDKYTDYQHAFLILDFAPLCLFQKASAYDIHAEFCEHSKKGDEIKIYFPQTDKQHAFKWKVSECSDLPPFDLCLSLSKNPWGGPRKYYSTSDPDSDALRDARQRLESFAALRDR